MKVLILSDLHSNLEATEACVAAAPAHDRVVILGDVVGYGGSPNEVTEIARKLGQLVVRGNHDKAVADSSRLEDFNPVAAAAVFWTRQQLTPDNLDWIGKIPQGPLRLEGLTGVQFVHGSPLDEDEYLITLHDALEPIAETHVPLTFFGHTHLQGGFAAAGHMGETVHPQYRSREEAETWKLALRNDTRYFINPGSVGQPRDGDWRAAFGVFDSDAGEFTYYRIPYDVDGAQQRIVNAHLPERLATRLAAGR